jgi:hypothetical protein
MFISLVDKLVQQKVVVTQLLTNNCNNELMKQCPPPTTTNKNTLDVFKRQQPWLRHIQIQPVIELQCALTSEADQQRWLSPQQQLACGLHVLQPAACGCSFPGIQPSDRMYCQVTPLAPRSGTEGHCCLSGAQALGGACALRVHKAPCGYAWVPRKQGPLCLPRVQAAGALLQG